MARGAQPGGGARGSAGALRRRRGRGPRPHPKPADGARLPRLRPIEAQRELPQLHGPPRQGLQAQGGALV
eukprot:6881725-Lingulodinium_polyedra.AAC.1